MMIICHVINNFAILVPRTCNEYQEQGAIVSGNYEIDPDGEGGGIPFTVRCDFENGKKLFSSLYYLKLRRF